MKSRKNLERAIVLGLMLSTSFCGTVFAEVDKEDLQDDYIWANGFERTETSNWTNREDNNYIIYNDGKYDKYDEDNELPNSTSGIGFNGTINIGDANLIVIAKNGNGISSGSKSLTEKANVNILAKNISIESGKNGLLTILQDSGIGGRLNIGSSGNAIDSLNIVAKGQGIDNKQGSVTVYGTDKSTIKMHSTNEQYNIKELCSVINNSSGESEDDGVRIKGGTVELTAEAGSGIITGLDRYVKYGVSTKYAKTEIISKSTVINASNDGIQNADGITSIKSDTIQITSGYGINKKIDEDISSEDKEELDKNLPNKSGINATKGTVELISTYGNTISAGTIDKNGKSLGDEHSIKASGASKVDLNTTNGDNRLYGVIYAKGVTEDDGTIETPIINLKHEVSEENSTTTIGEGSNYIYSTAHGSSDDVGNREKVVAALYAQNQGEINVIAGEGGSNHIETSYTDLDDPENSTGSERTVWAQRGGKIKIEGTTTIRSSNAEDFYKAGYATNSRGVAITAGSDKVDFDNFGNLADVENHSQVTLNYGVGSKIYGDIVAGYGGIIDITKEENNLTRANENNGLYMEGNALAANGGELTINLGNGGIWYGRADDYGDAGYGEDAKDKQNYYNPVFSDTIYTGGTVNINMGEGSKWYLTGQSWVSSLDVSKGNGNVTIDMERFNKGTHGLTISELKGISGGNVDATFVMDLDHNAHNTSDMLYIKNGTGEYDVELNNVIDGMEKINENNVLRFATVQGGASFNSVTMKDQGIYNLGFEIDHSEYNTADEEENKSYNGESVNTNKPGNENVEGFFGLENEEENTSKIMLLDEVDDAADNSIQNWYITKVLGQGLSDAGKTVLNMSRANYSQAV